MMAGKPHLRPQKMPRLLESGSPTSGPQPSLHGLCCPCLPGPPGLILHLTVCASVGSLVCWVADRARAGSVPVCFPSVGPACGQDLLVDVPRPQPEHRALPGKPVPFGQPWREAEIYLQGNKKVCISNGLRPIKVTPSSARLPGMPEADGKTVTLLGGSNRRASHPSPVVAPGDSLPPSLSPSGGP